MAYKDFTPDPFIPGVEPRSVNAETGKFTALEWTTIALARRDSLSSLREPGKLSRALGSLFGRNIQSRLADPALEMLRRVAVQAWHFGYQLPVSEVKAFLAVGFSTAQLDTLLASVGKARHTPRRGLFA